MSPFEILFPQSVSKQGRFQIFQILMLVTFLVGNGIIFSFPVSAQRLRQKSSEIATISNLAPGVTVQVASSAGLGSGVWVSSDGYIATCWHVVKDVRPTDQIKVRVGLETHFDLKNHRMATANFFYLKVRVVDHDESSDVAILKVTDPNPFKSRTLHNSNEFPALTVPEFQIAIPNTGEELLLLGYPLGRPHLLVQNGIVSGAGFEYEPDVDMPRPNIEKLTRIFVSVVSNPGNSGGPVLNRSGKLVGLLRGNLRSPVMDEENRVVMYVRPKRDERGTVLLTENGQPQFEIAPLQQNSGISVVIPSYFVTDILNRAITAVH